MPKSLLCACAVAAAVLGVGGTGCSGAIHRFTVNSTAPVIKAGNAAIDDEGDPQFAREAAPASLKTVEGFLVTSPENTDLLETLAQGYTQYAFGFLEDDLESMPDEDTPQRHALVDRVTYFYDKAAGFALRLTSQVDEHFPDTFKGDANTIGAKLNDEFGKEKYAPGLYWLGLATASAINLHRDDMNRIGDLPKAIALLERVHQIAPEYFHHGAALSLGVVYSSQGKAMGGNPEKSKQMFEEVFNATGGKYLMAKVLYARFYATVTQDRALFEKTLKEVLDTPATVWPEQRLANELARKRAARYLAQVEDLF
jgi:hypothetical protein